MADAKELLVGLLSSAYKLDEQGVAGLQEPDGSFKPDALQHLLDLDAKRVTALKGDPAEIEKLKDEQFGFGKRKALEDLERDLKAEYGFKDATKKGKELINAIIAEKLKAAAGDIDEKVKVHPLFLELEQKVKSMPDLIEKAKQEKEAEIKAELEKESHQRIVAEEAAVIFDELRPVLSQNPKVAAAQKRDFLALLQSGKFTVTVKDGTREITPMKPDGKARLEDNHGHAVPFKEFIRGLVTERFDLHQAEDRKTGPNPNDVGGRSGGEGGKFKLASKADYIKEHGRIEREVKDPKEQSRLWAELKTAAKEAGVL